MYISLEEARKIKGYEDYTDEDLTEIVTEICGVVDEYCNTVFVVKEVTEKSLYRDKIYLQKGPVIAIDEVIYSDESVEFIADITNGFIRANIPYAGFADIKYRYGYETVPSTVKSVIKDLLRYELSKLEVMTSIESESWDGDYSYTKKSNTDDVYKSIMSRLDIFKQSIVDTLADERNNTNISARWF